MKRFNADLMCLVLLQGCCVNAPMITVADYSNGSEGYTYNYFVCQISLNNFSFSPALSYCLCGLRRKSEIILTLSYATIHRKMLHLRKS